MDAELNLRKAVEARMHESDWMDGEPLDIGDGVEVAFHSATCSFCAAKLSPEARTLIIDKSVREVRRHTVMPGPR